MKENIELLNLLFENAEMGVYTTTELINVLKNKENKIKIALQSEIKEFEFYKQECEKLLSEYSEEPVNKSAFSKISSKMGINMKTIKDNSDARLSQMIIEGLTMGVVQITSKINDYKLVADKKIIKLCKRYVDYLENEIENLKKYM